MSAVPIPNLNLASASSSGPAYSGSDGIVLGDYHKGFTPTEIAIVAVVALVAYKLVFR